MFRYVTLLPASLIVATVVLSDEGHRHVDELSKQQLGTQDDEALSLLRGIAEKQKAGVFGVMGDLPAREMLADMLLDMKRPVQALVEYEVA